MEISGGGLCGREGGGLVVGGVAFLNGARRGMCRTDVAEGVDNVEVLECSW